tara:strand:- start:5879 stop:7753 length:1875 start_codon:yes stop_codon:yes gene_type:complete
MTNSNIQQIRARRAKWDKTHDELKAQYGANSIPLDVYNTAWNSTMGREKQFSTVKTPAPAQLDILQKQYFTQLIESDPRSAKLKGIVEEAKDLFPEVLGNIRPKKYSNLTPPQKEKRNQFIRAADECVSSDSDVTGRTIIQADPCKNTAFDQVQASLGNFLNMTTSPSVKSLNMPEEIRQVASQISNSMGSVVNKMTSDTNMALAAKMAGGYSMIKNMEFAKISPTYPKALAVKMTIAQQLPLATTASNLFNKITCGGVDIQKALKDSVIDLLTAAAANVTNPTSCVTEEIMGAIMNDITTKLNDVIGPLVEPLGEQLGFSFDPIAFLTSSVDVVNRVKDTFNCEETPTCPPSNKYVAGKGQTQGTSIASATASFAKMFEGVGIAQAAAQTVSGLTDFEKKYGQWDVFGSPSSGSSSALSPCDTECSGPSVSILGGGGSGAKGKLIFADFINKIDTNDIWGAIRRTASIAGVEITDPGSGYTSSPVVSIDDDCNEGYGAVAEATIDNNQYSPTYGQVTSVTMVTPGENYSADGEDVPLYVSGVVIANEGGSYQVDDTLQDFELEIIDGRITNVSLVNGAAYTTLPELNINTSTGVGAILRPIMSPIKPQGDIIKVIDCIGKIDE